METENLTKQKDWVTTMAHLSDIFSTLNDLNTSLQGQMVSVFKMTHKTEGFIRKLDIQEERTPNKCFTVFPNLVSIVDKDGYINLRCLTSHITGHLKSLSEHFSVYFAPNSDMRNGNE